MAIKYLKKLDIDYSQQVQEIVQKYEEAEKAWFFNRSGKVTEAIEVARFYVISLCEKDLVYVPKHTFITNTIITSMRIKVDYYAKF
jgi:hypothetical protein